MKLRKGHLKHNKLRKNNEKAEKYYIKKEETRNTEVQINEEEIGKLLEKLFRKMIVKMIKNLEKEFRIMIVK